MKHFIHGSTEEPWMKSQRRLEDAHCLALYSRKKGKKKKKRRNKKKKNGKERKWKYLFAAEVPMELQCL